MTSTCRNSSTAAAGWNSRNRRVAKQRSKTSWYKGKPEVEPPSSIQQEEEAARFSIHKEDPKQAEKTPQREHDGEAAERNAMEEGPDQESSGTETETFQKAGRRSGDKWNKVPRS